MARCLLRFPADARARQLAPGAWPARLGARAVGYRLKYGRVRERDRGTSPPFSRACARFLRAGLRRGFTPLERGAWPGTGVPPAASPRRDLARNPAPVDGPAWHRAACGGAELGRRL